MKDPYTYSTPDNDLDKGPEGKDVHLQEEMASKGPSEASVRKVLDFSKAYEVLDQGDGSDPIDLMRN